MDIRKIFAFLCISLLIVGVISCTDDESPELEPLEEAYMNDQLWHWIPKDEMVSRIGISSGYGVNFNSSSNSLLIYLEGGGACFNAITCLQNPNQFTEDDFNDRLASTGGQGEVGIFKRSNTSNPFNDWSFVYVPYTTGDVHSGDNPSSDVPGGLNDQQMVGYNNISVVLNDIAPFLISRGITEVFLSGASAGGYGTLINYYQVAEAFPDIDISMIADSSPVFLDTEIFEPCLNERLETTFNIQFPPDFENFTSEEYPFRTQRVYEYLSNKYPDSQFGFFAYYMDEVESYFFGFGQNDCQDAINPIEGEKFKSGLLQLADELEELGNWKVYYEEGDSHTILFSSQFETMTVSGVTFTDWLGQLNDKSASSVMR